MRIPQNHQIGVSAKTIAGYLCTKLKGEPFKQSPELISEHASNLGSPTYLAGVETALLRQHVMPVNFELTGPLTVLCANHQYTYPGVRSSLRDHSYVRSTLMRNVPTMEEIIDPALAESFLTMGLSDPDNLVRRQAAESLGQTGITSEEKTIILAGLLFDPAKEVQVQAISLLKGLGVGSELVVSTLNARAQTAVDHEIEKLAEAASLALQRSLVCIHNI